MVEREGTDGDDDSKGGREDILSGSGEGGHKRSDSGGDCKMGAGMTYSLEVEREAKGQIAVATTKGQGRHTAGDENGGQ